MPDQSIGINDPETIDCILTNCKSIAVVGISANPDRPSYDVSRYMQSHGYRIIPINPNETEILGERVYPNLAEVPQRVDLVNIFRKAAQAGAQVDEAIRLGARAVWLQEEVIDEAAAERALEAGLWVVMDRCLLKEHLRFKS